MEKAGDYPRMVCKYGCFGGGSNFSGFCIPCIHPRKIWSMAGKPGASAVGAFVVSETYQGKIHVRFLGDSAGMTPLLPMYTLGHTRFRTGEDTCRRIAYHGAGVLVSQLSERQDFGRTKQKCRGNASTAGVFFARNEGILLPPRIKLCYSCSTR